MPENFILQLDEAPPHFVTFMWNYLKHFLSKVSRSYPFEFLFMELCKTRAVLYSNKKKSAPFKRRNHQSYFNVNQFSALYTKKLKIILMSARQLLEFISRSNKQIRFLESLTYFDIYFMFLS